jgi:ankyrin repeat protein
MNSNAETEDFIAYCENGEMDEVSSRVNEQLANANFKGLTPLSCAIETNNVPLARLLLESKAKITDATTQYLDFIATCNHLDMVTLLLTHIELKYEQCDTLIRVAHFGLRDMLKLMVKAYHRRENQSLLFDIPQYLRKSDDLGAANVPLVLARIVNECREHMNARQSAYSHSTPLLSAVECNDADMVSALIKARAKVNYANGTDLCSPLASAVARDNIDMCKILFSAYPRPKVDEPAEENGSNILCVAVAAESTPIIDLLLEHRADVNVPRRLDGCTPIFLAKSTLTFNKLIDAGADLNHRCASGETILYQLLSDRHPLSSPDDLSTAMSLLDRNIDLSVRGPTEETILMFAIQHDNMRLFQKLLE